MRAWLNGLQGLGCVLETEEADQGIDVYINGIEGMHSAVDLGLKIAHEDSLLAFVRSAERGGASRFLHVDFEDKLMVSESKLLLGVVVSFLFSTAYRTSCAVVKMDGSFYFTAPPTGLLDSNPGNPAEVWANGDIVAYFENRGFGFLLDAQNRKYFFHVSAIADQDLARRMLTGFERGSRIPVEFVRGKAVQGEAYPKAHRIRSGEHAY